MRRENKDRDRLVEFKKGVISHLLVGLGGLDVQFDGKSIVWELDLI